MSIVFRKESFLFHPSQDSSVWWLGLTSREQLICHQSAQSTRSKIGGGLTMGNYSSPPPPSHSQTHHLQKSLLMWKPMPKLNSCIIPWNYLLGETWYFLVHKFISYNTTIFISLHLYFIKIWWKYIFPESPLISFQWS